MPDIPHIGNNRTRYIPPGFGRAPDRYPRYAIALWGRDMSQRPGKGRDCRRSTSLLRYYRFDQFVKDNEIAAAISPIAEGRYPPLELIGIHARFLITRYQ